VAERDEYDDNDGHDGGSDNDTPLVKDLRRQLRAAKKETVELTEKVTKLEAGSRERSVKDVLTAKGVRPGIARFVPKDVTDEADIVKWLEENADDLGITLSDDGGAGDQDAEPDPDADARRRAAAVAGRGIAPAKMADLEARMEKAQTPEEVDAIMAEAQQYVL
jgi:hypothetical protein